MERNVWRLLFYDFFISSLTSCRHNRNPTRVAEALHHWITNQRYQHDFDFDIFALINWGNFSFLRKQEKTRVGSSKREKFELRRKLKKSLFLNFLVFLFQPTALKRMWTRWRSERNCAKIHSRSLFSCGCKKDFFPFHFVLHSSSGLTHGSCEVERFSSSSTLHNDMMSQHIEGTVVKIYFCWSSKILYFGHSTSKHVDKFPLRKRKAAFWTLKKYFQSCGKAASFVNIKIINLTHCGMIG